MNYVPLSKIKIKQEYLKLVPRMTEDDDKKFDEAIKKNGIREPLIINKNHILLDGHSRYYKAKKYHIERVPFEFRNFSHPLEEKAYVIECNLQRRHLNTYQKIKMGIPLIEIEKKLARLRQSKLNRKSKTSLGSNDPKLEKGKATEKVAKKIGTSDTTMMRGQYVIKKATPQMEKKLDEGKLSVNTAYLMLTRKERNLPKAEIPQGSFDIIYCDVPIAFDNAGVKGNAEEHYPTLTKEQLIDNKLLLSAINENAIIFFWIPNSQLDAGMEILQAWGFRYKPSFVWDKEIKRSTYWLENQHEHLLLGMKGKMPLPAKLFPSIIREKRKNIHSKKPESVYSMIEQMYPKRKYLELFARTKHEGWEAFGNQL